MDIDELLDFDYFDDEPRTVPDCCIVVGERPNMVYLSGGRWSPEGWYPRKYVTILDKVPRSPRHRVEIQEWLATAKRESGARCKGFTTID